MILLADLVVALHVAWVAFVLFGLVAVLVGGALGMSFVRNRWFRGIHLAMILSVILRAMLWHECPLTTWERDFRAAAGQVDFAGSEVGYVLHRSIHPVGVPDWVFPVVYIIFGLLVVGAVALVPVDWRGKGRAPEPTPPDPEPLPSRG